MRKEEYYVSVVIAEYNTKIEHFEESIKSILGQSHKYFELIIVDDCGKNDVEKIVKKFNDDRIIVLKNKENQGLAKSLNYGFEKAKYDYVFRMDTDDICFPDRFEKQISFALKHPEYSIIGGNHLLFDNDGEYPKKVLHSGEIHKNDFLFNTPFSHPTLLIKRKDLLESGGYPNFRRGQDYAMEMNMYIHGYKGYVMDEVLIKYRQDQDAYKKKNYKSRLLEYKIRKSYFKKIGLPWYRVFYEVKPLIIGLIPRGLLKKYHERHNK